MRSNFTTWDGITRLDKDLCGAPLKNVFMPFGTKHSSREAWTSVITLDLSMEICDCLSLPMNGKEQRRCRAANDFIEEVIVAPSHFRTIEFIS